MEFLCKHCQVIREFAGSVPSFCPSCGAENHWKAVPTFSEDPDPAKAYTLTEGDRRFLKKKGIAPED